jgi:hypothetical protein
MAMNLVLKDPFPEKCIQPPECAVAFFFLLPGGLLGGSVVIFFGRDRRRNPFTLVFFVTQPKQAMIMGSSAALVLQLNKTVVHFPENFALVDEIKCIGKPPMELLNHFNRTITQWPPSATFKHILPFELVACESDKQVRGPILGNHRTQV